MIALEEHQSHCMELRVACIHRRMRVGESMKISFIMPTRNRSAILSRALGQAVAALREDRRAELIVVDNGSTDDTRKVIESHRSSAPNVRYVSETKPGLLAGRHAGWRVSTGDVLVFLDDDVFVEPTIADAYREVFQDRRVGLAGGNNLPLFETKPPQWLEEVWQGDNSGRHLFPELSIISLPDREPVAHDPYLVWGCNFAVTRTVLGAARGFHPDGVPDDLIRYRGDGETYIATYVRNNGFETIFHPAASVQHLVPTGRMTLGYMKKRAFANGVSSSFGRIRERHFRRSSLAKSYNFVVEAARRASKRLLGHPRHQSPAPALFSTDFDEANIHGLIKHYTSEGRKFHRQAFETDKSVYDWVLRQDYIGSEDPTR